MSTIADSILSLLEPGKSRKVDVLYRFDGTQEVVSAHKYLLAFISPVLDEKFFGPLAMPPGEFPEGVEEIEESEFGFETFDIFVKHVYGDKEVIKNSSNYRILMELLQLSKLYFMTGLADLVATRIDELQVNMENLMEVLVTALHYKDIDGFVDVSDNAISKVIKVFSKLSSREQNKFYKENRKDYLDPVLSLIDLMAEPNQWPNCDNCLVPLVRCKNRRLVDVLPHIGLRMLDAKDASCIVESVVEDSYGTGGEYYEVGIRGREWPKTTAYPHEFNSLAYIYDC